MILCRWNHSWLLWDNRKHELLRILKYMYYAAEKEDIESIKALSNLYNEQMVKIFDRAPWKHETEAFEWDNARNAAIGIPTLLGMYKTKRFKENDYEKMKKAQLAELLKRIKKVEEYLI